MQKRPLVVCTILFFLGMLISFYKLSRLITFVLLTFVFSIQFVKNNKARLLAVALIIILSGIIRMEFARMHKEKEIATYEGETGEMTLIIAEPSADGRAIAFLETDSARIKVYLSVKTRCEFLAGDIVTGEIKLRAPGESKNKDSAFSNYLASQGTYLQTNAENVRIVGRYEKGFEGKIYSIRRYATNIGGESFLADSRTLFNAMVLGDKSLLSDELYANLQGSGLNHIAVVSGMHLSVVIAFIIFLARNIFGKGRIGFIIAISGAVFITLITGAGASIVRAFIMCFIYYLSRILYRENDGLTSLFCTFWVMVIINPYIIFDVGFVLSVLSVLGIILYGKKFSAFLKKLIPEKAAEAIALTLSAQLVLTPVIVHYFGVITPYAPLSNIFAVPLSSIYVVLGMLLVLLYPIKPIASALVWVMNIFADGIINLCESISSLPFALFEFSGDFFNFSVGWIFVAIIIFYHPTPSK